MTDQLKTALADGRDAMRRMQDSASDAGYLDAAADLAEAFDTIDRIITSTERTDR